MTRSIAFPHLRTPSEIILSLKGTRFVSHQLENTHIQTSSPKKKEILKVNQHSHINYLLKSFAKRPNGTVLDNFPLAPHALRRSIPGAEESLNHLLPPSNRLVLSVVAIIAKLFLRFYSKTKVYGLENLMSALLDPKYANRPIITISNHVSTMDDPFLFGTLPFNIVNNSRRMRWCLGARELCFSSKIVSFFCGSGRVLPIIRGDGIYQPAIDLSIKKLNDGGWIHLFPEGFVSQDMKNIKMFRWGVARMILECKQAPLIVPFYHEGLNVTMPLEPEPPIPKYGSNIHIYFGKIIDMKDNRLLSCPPTLMSPENIPYGASLTEAQRLKGLKNKSLDNDDSVDSQVNKYSFKNGILTSLNKINQQSDKRNDCKTASLDFEKYQRIALCSFLQQKLSDVRENAVKVIKS